MSKEELEMYINGCKYCKENKTCEGCPLEQNSICYSSLDNGVTLKYFEELYKLKYAPTTTKLTTEEDIKLINISIIGDILLNKNNSDIPYIGKEVSRRGGKFTITDLINAEVAPEGIIVTVELKEVE